MAWTRTDHERPADDAQGDIIQMGGCEEAMQGTMITADEALELVIQTAGTLRPQACAISDACGLVLAEGITASHDYPAFRRSMMDGYAVRLADAGRAVPVEGEIPAGQELGRRACRWPLPGHIDRRTVPGGYGGRGAERANRDARQKRCPTGANISGQNIAAQGSECRGSSRVVDRDETDFLGRGRSATFGKTEVQVVPLPRLSIITTGGELARQEVPVSYGRIRNSNGPMLAAMAKELGLEVPHYLQASDNLAELRQALEQSCDADIVVLTGGVSVGTYDLVPQALAAIGAEQVFHGVRQKPGKPLLFARNDRQLFFGLPGNPLACHFGFHRYVSTAVRKMSGREGKPCSLRGTLTAAVDSRSDRTHFMPAHAEPALDSPSTWRVGSLRAASSADIFNTSSANCYLEAPPLDRPLVAGEVCRFTWIGNQS